MRPELSHGISLNTLNNLIVRSRNDQFYKVLCISCLLGWLAGWLAGAAHQLAIRPPDFYGHRSWWISVGLAGLAGQKDEL